MPLTAGQISQFRAQGFTTVLDFFTTREVHAMQAELNRLKQAGLLRNVATAGDGKTMSTRVKNLQLCPLTPKSTFFRAMPFEPKIVEAVQALIGEPYVLYLDQIFLKPARHGSGTGWHQDNAYFKISDPTKGVGMWTAMHTATLANGTMHIIPGSHQEVFAHERDPNSDHHIGFSAPEERALPIELPAGGVLFFNYGIAHCTKANTTDTERAGLALHFLHADYIPEKNNFHRTYLTGPMANGGEREYGTKVAGTWEREIAAALQAG